MSGLKDIALASLSALGYVVGAYYFGYGCYRLGRAVYIKLRSGMRLVRLVLNTLSPATVAPQPMANGPQGQVGVDWFPLPPKDDAAGAYALAEMLVRRLQFEKQSPLILHLVESWKARAAMVAVASVSRN